MLYQVRLEKGLAQVCPPKKEKAQNEVTNPAIAKSIRAYEEGELIPTLVDLEELKVMLHA